MTTLGYPYYIPAAWENDGDEGIINHNLRVMSDELITNAKLEGYSILDDIAVTKKYMKRVVMAFAGNRSMISVECPPDEATEIHYLLEVHAEKI